MKRVLHPREVMQQLAGGEPVSGEALAEHLGVTRAAVWKQIAALRELGLPVQARTKVGYCLPWPVQLLDAARIQQESGPAGPPVHVHWELPSTQDALAAMQHEAPDLTVVLAEYQASGRGRRGHGWVSPPCLGIYLSCLKRFAGGPATLAGLSIAAGVAVADALADMGAGELQLKWPNDVLADGAKLAGILIEVQGEYDGPCSARVGVGVNVRLPPSLPGALDQAVTDLAARMPRALLARNALAACLIRHLRAALLDFEREGLAPFLRAYAGRDMLAGRPLALQGMPGLARGTGRGVDARGALLVEHEGGVTAIQSSHVSVRLAPG